MTRDGPIVSGEIERAREREGRSDGKEAARVRQDGGVGWRGEEVGGRIRGIGGVSDPRMRAGAFETRRVFSPPLSPSRSRVSGARSVAWYVRRGTARVKESRGN